MPRAPSTRVHVGDYVLADLPTGVPAGKIMSLTRTHVVLVVTDSSDPDYPYPVPYGFRKNERITVPRRRIRTLTSESYRLALLTLRA